MKRIVCVYKEKYGVLREYCTPVASRRQLLKLAAEGKLGMRIIYRIPKEPLHEIYM